VLGEFGGKSCESWGVKAGEGGVLQGVDGCQWLLILGRIGGINRPLASSHHEPVVGAGLRVWGARFRVWVWGLVLVLGFGAWV
jgi:hypothetical protein